MKKILKVMVVFLTIAMIMTLSSCKKKIKITWMDEAGNLIATTEVKKGEIPSYNYTPADGYDFKGWSASLNGNVLNNLPAASEDATYYAAVTKKTNYCTLTFNSEGGSSVTSITKEVNSSINKPTDPTYTGYRFVGWTKDLSTKEIVNWPFIIEADVTLHAVWIKQVTITFNSNGGSMVDSITVDINSEISEPEIPTYTGYRFVGWTKDLSTKETINWPLVVDADVTLYAVWNQKVEISQYLEALLDGFEFNPYEYIPQTMRAEYSNNLVTSDFTELNYENFVNVSQIKYGGFGEQWHMILDNIEQSKNFFNVLSVIEGLATTSIAAFNNYLDKNPSDTASYQFKEGIYNVMIDFDGSIISYILEYIGNLPIFNEQKIQIAISYNIETKERTGRIQIGDANALKYVVKADSYSFGIRYLGIRRAYFEISKDANNHIKGSIYEHLSVDDTSVSSSAAQFETDGQYLSAVGNKAGGMIGFKGYINELYSLQTGKLLGYEVRETLSSIQYDTLWFNLNEISGIDQIKVVNAKNSENNNPNTIYINNSDTAFVTKKYGGIGTKMLSRRYDIELRTQYYYYYDVANEKYVEVATKVPMFFVQQEKYEDVVSDVFAENKINIGININNQVLQKIEDDYAKLIDQFIIIKDQMSVQAILDYIGAAYQFDQN